MALVIEELKAKADVSYGDEICQQRSKFLLQEVGLPRGLLPLKDMIEGGYVEETGFVWLRQKKRTEHRFDKIGKTVSYAPEITGYVEKFKIKKLTGVKAKELMMWVNLSEISIDESSSGRLTCKTPMGLYKTYPSSAFEIEEEEDKKEMEMEMEKEKETEKEEKK